MQASPFDERTTREEFLKLINRRNYRLSHFFNQNNNTPTIMTTPSERSCSMQHQPSTSYHLFEQQEVPSSQQHSFGISHPVDSKQLLTPIFQEQKPATGSQEQVLNEPSRGAIEQPTYPRPTPVSTSGSILIPSLSPRPKLETLEPSPISSPVSINFKAELDHSQPVSGSSSNSSQVLPHPKHESPGTSPIDVPFEPSTYSISSSNPSAQSLDPSQTLAHHQQQQQESLRPTNSPPLSIESLPPQAWLSQLTPSTSSGLPNIAQLLSDVVSDSSALSPISSPLSIILPPTTTISSSDSSGSSQLPSLPSLPLPQVTSPLNASASSELPTLSQIFGSSPRPSSPPQILRPPEPRSLLLNPDISAQQTTSNNTNRLDQNTYQRSFRPRKQCQIKPYTTETHRYVRALEATDWQDAVVRLPPNKHQISHLRPEPSDNDHDSDGEMDQSESDESSSDSDLHSSQIGQFCQRSFKRLRRASSEGPRRPNQPRFRDHNQNSPLPTRRPVASTSRRPIPSTSHQPVASTSHQPIASTSRQPIGSTSHQPIASISRRPIRSEQWPHQARHSDLNLGTTSGKESVHQIPGDLSVSSTSHLTTLRRTLSLSPTRTRHHLSTRRIGPEKRPPRGHQAGAHLSSHKSSNRGKTVTRHKKQKTSDKSTWLNKFTRTGPNPSKRAKTFTRSGPINSTEGNAERSSHVDRSGHRKVDKGKGRAEPDESSPEGESRILDLTLSSSPLLNNSKRAKSARGSDSTDIRRPSTSVHRSPPHLSRPIRFEDEEEEEEEDDEDEESAGDEELLREDVLPKKVKLKVLNRMMPKSYVKKAEKDLALMEQERKHGRVKLTEPVSDDDDDDDDSQEDETDQVRRNRAVRRTVVRRKPSISPPRRSETIEPERPGINWADKLVSRVPSAHHHANRTPSPEVRISRYHPSRRSPSIVEERITRPMPKRSNPVMEEQDLEISLKDDHAFWRTSESSNVIPSRNLANPMIINRNHQDGNDDDIPRISIMSEINSFKDFTPDFSIHPPKTGWKVQSEMRYISEGQLIELLNILQDSDHELTTTTINSYEFFGQSFTTQMRAEEFIERLNDIGDLLQDELNGLLALDPDSTIDGYDQTCQAFKFFGRFVSRHRPSVCTTGPEVLTEGVRRWVESMIERFDDLVLDSVNRFQFSKVMLVISWGLFELGCRLFARIGNLEIVERTTQYLVRRLLEYGPPRTMSSLKSTIDQNLITDTSVEIWVCLINLVLLDPEPPRRAACLSDNVFWNLVMEETQRYSEKLGLIGIVARGETRSYMTISLCALSCFLSNGEVGDGNCRLGSHWSLILDLLGNLPENILVEPTAGRLGSERRDCYVRSLFGRALILHHRWGWKLVFEDGILDRFYKLLHHLKFQQLGYEVHHHRRFGGPYVLPEVLRDTSSFQLTQWGSPEGIGGQDLRDDDTCFGIFLKLLIQSAKALEWPLDINKRQEIERIISRCNPVRQLTFQPLGGDLGLIDDKITPQTRSSFIQICSLFLIYGTLFPKTLKRQLSFFDRLYKFEAVDQAIRDSHLQIWVKALDLLPWSDCPASTFVEKFSGPISIVIKEFIKLHQHRIIVRERLSGLKNGIGKEREAIENELTGLSEACLQRVGLVERILKSLCHGFESWCRVESKRQIGLEHRPYPDLVWLDPAWTIELSQSSIFKEGSVSKLFNKMMRTFLDQRAFAIEDLEKMRFKIDQVTESMEDDAYEIQEQIEGIERREKKLNDEIDVRVVRPICGHLIWIGNSISSSCLNYEPNQDLLEVLLGLTDTWARADEIKRRNGQKVEHWMRTLTIRDSTKNASPLTVNDEAIRLTIGMRYILTILRLGQLKYEVIRQDSLLVWFSSIVTCQLTIQEEFTIELVKVEHVVFPDSLSGLISNDDMVEFGVRRLEIIKEVIEKFKTDLPSSESKKYIGTMAESICKTIGELNRRKGIGKDLIDRYINGVVESFIKSLDISDQSCWISLQSIPKLRLLKKFIGDDVV